MNSQIVEFTTEPDDKPLTVDEKYKRLAACSLQRGAQVAGRFRVIRVLLDDAIHRQVKTKRDRDRINAILSLTLEKVEDFEQDANEFVDPSTFICMDASGFDIPQGALLEALQLMSDSHAPRERSDATRVNPFDVSATDAATRSHACTCCRNRNDDATARH
ncbi:MULTISPECIES: hypothetical protein [Paraburkholderia]|uniref:Uncharacterized protein n=1 Tax=Paraburkholderia largidicola TaxID=3014751 RepID=A0A7I8BZ07_9BURK|nr:hypothetical protein [Paraburkholderia sp. PGU16]BCF93972.1 hypothetical protein PPGU16_70390 [Paraburkholderia sp. PGU16]GJH33979.1 hypothetical protein CBA19CS91_14500 [Paraburkholderia hospita]